MSFVVAHEPVQKEQAQIHPPPTLRQRCVIDPRVELFKPWAMQAMAAIILFRRRAPT